MSRPVYIHQFDLRVEVPSFESDPSDIKDVDLKLYLMNAVNHSETWKLLECLDHIQTIDPDIHMTTAKDWGLK